MRVTIDGVGTYEVSEVALPQLMAVINTNKAISIPANENKNVQPHGAQLLNE